MVGPHRVSPRAEAARLIRRHFWTPCAPDSRDARPWTMARELEVWGRLSKKYGAADLNAAIPHVRAVGNVSGPIRMLLLAHRRRGPVLIARALAAHHRATLQATPAVRGGGLSRVEISL